MEETKDLPPPYEYSPYLQQNEYGNPYGQPSAQFVQPHGQYMPQQLIQQQPMHQMSSHTTVVLSQPAAPVITTLPYNYSSLAWRSCLFCCCPLGIVAIIKSNEVDAAISAGDMQRAQKASQEARRYGNMAVYVGLALHLLSIIFVVLARTML